MEQIIIGEGSYGVVAAKKNSSTVNKYCHWLTDRSSVDSYLVCSTIREVCFYQYLRRANSTPNSYFSHPPASINKVHSATRNETAIALAQHHHGKRLTSLTDSDRNLENFQKIFHQILQGIHWLHSYGASHGDIKADNILVDLNFKATLIDFGSACFFHHPGIVQEASRCTITTVAPEEVLHPRWTIECDVWSIAVVMFEFLTKKIWIVELIRQVKGEEAASEWHRLVYKKGDTDGMEQGEKILKDLYANATSGQINALIGRSIADRSICEILGAALVVDKRARCTAWEMLNSPVFAGVEVKFFPAWNFTGSGDAYPYDTLEIKKAPGLDRQLALQFIALMVSMPKSPFRRSWFGHACMLFDRWQFRAAAKRVLPQNLSSHAIIALAVTGAILSHSCILMKDLATHSKTDEAVLEHEMADFFDVMGWQVWNMSPDLWCLKKWNRQPTIKIQLKLYLKMALLTDSVDSLSEMLWTMQKETSEQ